MVLALIVFFYIEDILVFVQNSILIPRGMSSRALRNYIRILQSDEVDIRYLTSGRSNISKFVKEYFIESPFFGIGIGTFRERTGYAYTHNIITDAITSFGIFGGSIILAISAKAIINTFKVREKNLQLLLFILFIQCFPRLLFSKTFVNDVSFWIYIVFALQFGKAYRSIGYLEIT